VREFGIRAAIGASPSDLSRLVLGSAMGMAVTGIVIGLFSTLLLSWLIASRVRAVDFDSPVTYALVGLLQLTIAIGAAAIPGRRASRADPLAALRTD
jgi:ABC-type antimicrobial peptide transport system permease subunit